jgi:hypothetical protein
MLSARMNVEINQWLEFPALWLAGPSPSISPTLRDAVACP